MTFHTPLLNALQAAPMQQHPAFGAALTKLGRSPARVVLPDPAREVLVMRRRFGPVAVGLISRADISVRDLPHLRAATGCRILLLNAETEGSRDGVPPGVALRTAPHVAELALGGPAASLRAGMAQKWRNRLNHASGAGLRVHQSALPADPRHWLLRADQAQQKRKRYRAYPPGFTAAFAAANREQARLFEARLGGTIVAAMLFLCHGTVATYHIGWNGSEGRRLCAHNLLLWRAMTGLTARGCTRLDLGGLDTETAPGLARFKLGAGATCRKLGETRAILLRGACS